MKKIVDVPMLPIRGRNKVCWAIIMLLTLFLINLLLTTPPALGDKGEDGVSIIGSGTLYTTSVERETEGELSAEDFRQVTTLGSHIIAHLNKATECVEDHSLDKAAEELEKALVLCRVIRKLLPTTTVVTVVKDAGGKEVYRSKEVVQDDLVPVYRDMIAVDVVQPVEAARRQLDAAKGLMLADAEIIETSVLLDLGYVERKMNRTRNLMTKDTEQAFDELVLAQTVGIQFSVDKEDSSLIKAQRALRLAERMVNDKKIEGAEANLRLARFYLDTYKTVVDEKRAEKVAALQEDIDRLFGTLEEEESESRIRGLWGRVTNWFSREPGQSHQTTAGPEDPE